MSKIFSNKKYIAWMTGITQNTQHTDSYTYTSHLQYVFQMRGLSLFCTVNTVPHTLKLITVELICSQVVLTCTVFVQS